MINTCKNNHQQHYVPMGKLTYKTKLKQLLKEELGYQGKPKVLDLLANEIEAITKECYQDADTMGLGQIKILVPHIDDRPSWSQTIEDTVLVPVILTLIAEEDTQAYRNGEKSAIIIQKRLARIANEAIKQKGVLSMSVAAELLGIKQTTVSKYVQAYYKREGKIVPLRGMIHDIGRSTTHKRWIIDLYLKGYTENEIQKITDHKITSIDRYVKRFESVVSAIEELQTTDTQKIARLLGITLHSAKEYTAIYLEYKATGNIEKLDYFGKINEQTEKVFKESKKLR